MLKLDYSHATSFFKDHELAHLEPQLNLARTQLLEKNGPGNDFLGWVNLPAEYDQEEFDRIISAAEYIKTNADVLVVIGIGGSYLGARAVIEALKPYFNATAARPAVEVIFAGYNLSGSYLADLMDYLQDKRVSLNVISKSGTTTEPAIAFRVLKAYMENRYGKAEARQRIFATTDRSRGALKGLADKEGYETFVVPDDVGGRFSVLTAVGLLPIAAAGFDITRLMEGAEEARQTYLLSEHQSFNDAETYAAIRTCLLRKGYDTEIVVNYEPQLHYFTEWWKQLYGESEGKDHRGLLPAGVDFTSDLHSMGQFIQDGRRGLLETVLHVSKPRRELTVPAVKDNADGLNFLAGMDMLDVNDKAVEGTVLAHADGGVPNLLLTVDGIDEANLGRMIYFFEYACALSGYMNAVNPFDQPGVEAYKKNMFALLGKPGYEEQRARLEQQLKA
ncbi:glucose-6-phosphate isomerase [Oscillospiraceae bacterium HV4-5-C5C]|nr:glucose-6-phosphate isomerase [Oscillospiraceae bacterium HV4-5-C5C]